MPTTLPPVLLRAPVVERQTLTLTSPWLQWFEQSYIRQGGQEAASNTELAGGVAGNADHIGQVEDALGQTNTTVAGLEAELTTTQEALVAVIEDVAALTTRVDTLETGLTALTERVTTLEGRVTTLETTVAAQATRLAALETWKTAVQGALPAVVSVTAVPNLTNDPATAILLENDLTANWRGTLNTNDSGLATAVNAVRNALAA